MGGVASVTHNFKFYMEKVEELSNQQSISKKDLLYQLEGKVCKWVERSFNYIQVEVAEKMADNHLFEYIRQPSPTDVVYDYLDDCDEIQVIEDWAIETKIKSYDEKVEKYVSHNGAYQDSFEYAFGDVWNNFIDYVLENYEDDIQEYIDEQQDENYPMWNTLFEFRDDYYNNDETCEKVTQIGCGIIQGLEPFNNMVFMQSCGHSFYGSYWIPLYFEFYPDEKEKYKGIDYSSL